MLSKEAAEIKEAKEFTARAAYKEKERQENLLEIEATKYLHKQFATMATKLGKKHAAIIKERKDKALELVSQYASVDEALEAYGWGMISEKELEAIKDTFERGEKIEYEHTVESLSQFRLREFMRQLDYIRHELEYECMSPEERAAYDKKIEEVREKAEQVHKHTEEIRGESNGNN